MNDTPKRSSLYSSGQGLYVGSAPRLVGDSFQVYEAEALPSARCRSPWR